MPSAADDDAATHQLWNYIAAYDAVDPAGPIDASDPQDTPFSRDFRRHYAKRALADLEAVQAVRTKRDCIRSVAALLVSKCQVAHPNTCVGAIDSLAFRRLYTSSLMADPERIDASLKRLMGTLPFADEGSADALLEAFYRAAQATVAHLEPVRAPGEDDADLALWLDSVGDVLPSASRTELDPFRAAQA